MPACLLNDPSRTPFQANPFGWATAVPNARYSCKLRARATGVLVRPGKIIGVGRNYVEHAAELGNAVPERPRSEEHTSELQSRLHIVCRLLLVKKKALPEQGRGVRSGKD